MRPDERRALLDDLYRGRTSRNRGVELFAKPEGGRVLRGYRRVKAVLREAARPGVQVRVRWLEGGQHLAVAVEDSRLRYRRVVLLSSWEAAFLVSVASPETGFPLGALGGC